MTKARIWNWTSISILLHFYRITTVFGIDIKWHSYNHGSLLSKLKRTPYPFSLQEQIEPFLGWGGHRQKTCHGLHFRLIIGATVAATAHWQRRRSTPCVAASPPTSATVAFVEHPHDQWKWGKRLCRGFSAALLHFYAIVGIVIIIIRTHSLQLSPPGLVPRKDKGTSSAGASPSHSRRAHSQPHSSPGKTSNGTSPNGRSKGVPQSFGYIKRQANGSGMASNMVTMDAQQHLLMNGQQQQQQQANRSMAQVSAVPRGGKIKMSSPGGNQSTQDLHARKWMIQFDLATKGLISDCDLFQWLAVLEVRTGVSHWLGPVLRNSVNRSGNGWRVPGHTVYRSLALIWMHSSTGESEEIF